MAKKDGKLFVMKFATASLVGRTTGSMNLTADMLDVTTADSVKFKEFIAGEANCTLSVGGLYDPDAAEGASEAIAYLMAGTHFAWYWGESTGGSTYWTGQALISGVTITGDKNSPASYSIEIQNTGEISEATVAAS